MREYLKITAAIAVTLAVFVGYRRSKNKTIRGATVRPSVNWSFTWHVTEETGDYSQVRVHDLASDCSRRSFWGYAKVYAYRPGETEPYAAEICDGSTHKVIQCPGK